MGASITATPQAASLLVLLFAVGLFDPDALSFEALASDFELESDFASDAVPPELAAFDFPFEEEYPSEYQPPPLRVNEVIEIRRFTLRERQTGQVFTGSSLIRCSTSNSWSHFPQAYS